ncbi:hypothetical protein RHGRI_023801 [Rhododendron griersonianum]|uniref:RING-type E3 ubiquitin transferase n=1 Tax=Rhododendron griersonianum TaxID=479676 RepID=A0AAV6JC32_9ERIC|nr:hypothetical protein RHGRI_023801 [Rhododendron griersonianum]
MSSVAPDTSTIAEDSRCRKPRNQPISETDPPNPQQIPWNTIQSTRPKSSISSLLLSTTKAINTLKKMNFTPPASFRRLGCVFTVSSQVTERETPANWEGKKKQKQKKKSRVPNQADDGKTNMNASSSVPASSVVVPDVGCGPGIGLGTDAAAVDCVVSTRPISATERVDADKMNQRQRASCSTRRMVNPEPMSFMDSDRYFEMRCSELDVFGSSATMHWKVWKEIKLRGSESGRCFDATVELTVKFAGLQMMMFRSSIMMGERSGGFDRYRDWRLNVDNMSYEELLELGDRIGYVNTGLKEDMIVQCLRKTKLSDNLFSPLPTEMERKCSICQEDYEGNDEVGKLECGHFYHIYCIKQELKLHYSKYAKAAHRRCCRHLFCKLQRVCKITFAGGVEYRVVEGVVYHVVNLRAGTCCCKVWEISGLPCKRAASCISHKRMNIEEFCHTYYHRDTYLRAYGEIIHPLHDETMWEEVPGESV